MTFSQQIGNYLLNNKLLLTTAESCTAGLIASTLAQTPGSSSWLDSGFVVYSPQAKNRSLGVKFETIEKFNITSEEVALEMAHGALKNSHANIAVSTTGVAGPTGGSDKIPVGTVCMAWVFQNNNQTISYSETKVFIGNRNQIRKQAVKYILNKIKFFHKLNMKNSVQTNNRMVQSL